MYVSRRVKIGAKYEFDEPELGTRVYATVERAKYLETALGDFLREKGNKQTFQVASMRDLFLGRPAAGINHLLSQEEYFVSQCAYYDPSRGNFLLLEHPLITTFKRELQEGVVPPYYRKKGSPHELSLSPEVMKRLRLSSDDLEQMLEGAISLPQRSVLVPAQRIGEEELFVQLIGKNFTQSYGDFLQEQGIEYVPLLVKDEQYVGNKKHPFVHSVFVGDVKARDYKERGSRGHIQVGSTINGKSVPRGDKNFLIISKKRVAPFTHSLSKVSRKITHCPA